MKRIGWMIPMLLVMLPSLVSAAAPNPQVEAATADAIESLKRQIIATHITPELTVQDLLDRAGGEDQLNQTIHGAQQLGGERWLGDQAVQVRLSIDGNKVAQTLIRIGRSAGTKSPIPPESLERRLRDWADRIFSATGTSLGAADVTRLRPAASDRSWWGVSDGERRRALLNARNNAANRLLESIGPVELGGGKTLADVISDPDVRKDLTHWIESQPVKSVSFSDDLTVQLTLDAPADHFWPILRNALEHQKQFPLPATPGEWDNLQQKVIAKGPMAVGTGVVEPKTQPAAQISLPLKPPDWANQEAEAEATAPDHGGRLHTARNAEDLALEKLRRQVEDLPLMPDLTIAAACQRDPRIEKAVARALRTAKPYQVDYGPNGAATVHVVLHLSDLWAEIDGRQ